jgi:Ca2+-binding EF-hand superfamily protein
MYLISYRESGINSYQGKNVDEIIKSCDKDDNGAIDFNEFREALLRKA